MKILHTNFHHGWGGQSNRIRVECQGLADLGHQVVLAVPENSGLHRRLDGTAVELFTKVKFRRGLRLGALYNDITRLRKLMRERQFDIIHTHGSQDSWAVAFSMLGLKPRPIVIRSRHNIFPIQDHFMNRWLYASATDYLVCISNAIVEYCAAKPYLKRENLELIASAVDVEKFASGNRQTFREAYQLTDDHLAVGIVGRLRSEKGHKFLFPAWKKFAAENLNARLLVVGAGSLEEELKQQVQDLEIEDSVIFTGFRDDIPNILAGLDVFVMPSISEGLGTAILEAGAASLPIIASDVGGIPDIIEHEKTGLLVETQNSDSILQALQNLTKDPQLQTQLKQNIHHHVQTNFSEQNLITKTESFYKRILG